MHGKRRAHVGKQHFFYFKDFKAELLGSSFSPLPGKHCLLPIIFLQTLKKHCSFVQLQETTITRLAPKQAKNRHLETTSYQYKQTEIKFYYNHKLQHPADFSRESQNNLTHQLISSSSKIRLFYNKYLFQVF